jgi:predicted ATPase
VRGVFDVEPEAISVKGVDRPLATYLVTRLKPRAFRVPIRGIEGIETCMVGREAELERLRRAFAEVLRDRRCASMTVVAEAGLGKSRLLYEFDHWAETLPEAFYQFEGRATPHTESEPYALLRDIVFRRFEIDDADSPDDVKAKLERGLMPLFAPSDGEDLAAAQVHVLGHLIGMDYSASPHVSGIVEDSLQIRNRGFMAAAKMFRRFADGDGALVVLELEDLHWADDPSLDFVLYLADVSSDVPLLIVSLARPMLYERRRQWRSADPRHHRIDLTPLDKGASRVLANELLKKLPEVPQALRELVTGTAEGNPFYMEELVRMLVSQGVIGTHGEHWELHAERLVKVHIPSTLTGVVQGRLDSLPSDERTMLQQASVIGVVFWDAALEAINPSAPRLLRSLVERELIVPQAQASLEGVREYAFRHHILQQVTYDTLLKHARKALHARVADWLTTVEDARSGEIYATAAGHYEEAGDIANACEYYARASEHAASRFAHETVRQYTAHALAMCDLPGTNRLQVRSRLLAAHYEAVRRLGLEDEETRALDQLLADAESRGDEVAKARAFTTRAEFLWRRGQSREAEAAALHALEAAEASGDDNLRLDATTKLAGALFNLGEQDRAAEMVELALSEARALGALRVEAQLVNMLGIFAAAGDDVLRSLVCSRRHLELQRLLGNRVMETIALANIGTNVLDLGAYAEAEQYLEEALRLARVVGPRESEGWALYLLSTVALCSGRHVEALAAARSALEIAMAGKLPSRQVGAMLAVGEAELALGRFDEAMHSFERATDVADVISITERFDAMAGQARVALARGDPSDALHRIAPLVDHVLAGKPLTHAEVPRLILWTCYRVLAANGDGRADSMLDIAHTNLQERAGSISDEAYRRSFLDKIAEHRDTVVAWKMREERRSELHE